MLSLQNTSSIYRAISFGLAPVIALSTTLLVSVARAGTMTPIYDPYSNSNLYIVGSNSASWTQSETQAQALGGNLITIHSAAEDQFVANAVFANLTNSGEPNLSNAYAVWIGLYDPTGIVHDDGPGGPNSKHAADFAWVDGESAPYRNWNTLTGEPNDGAGGPFEYYTQMYGPDATPVNVGNGGTSAPTGTWNDVPNTFAVTVLGTTGFYGIASVPAPEPTFISLLGMGAILAARYRPSRELTHRHKS